MIPKRDLQQLRSEWTLDIGVIEKDYVLGWLLAGIAQHPALAERWIFKGGTEPVFASATTRRSGSPKTSTSPS